MRRQSTCSVRSSSNCSTLLQRSGAHLLKRSGTHQLKELQRRRSVCLDLPGRPAVLTTRQLEEVRQLHHPPPVVRRVLELVHLLLHKKPPASGDLPWEQVLRTVASPDFIRRLDELEVDAVQQCPELARRLFEAYIQGGDPPLTRERVQQANIATAALFRWSSRLLQHTREPLSAREIEATTEIRSRTCPFASCPGQHTLASVDQKAHDSRCSVCRREDPNDCEGASVCRECDYHVCSRCLAGESFEVRLDVNCDEPSGLLFSAQNHCHPHALRVDVADNGGSATHWYASFVTSPTGALCALCLGDLIFEVNGIAGDTDGMLAQVRGGHGPILLSVFRTRS